jgi:hypothetical protein
VARLEENSLPVAVLASPCDFLFRISSRDCSPYNWRDELSLVPPPDGCSIAVLKGVPLHRSVSVRVAPTQNATGRLLQFSQTWSKFCHL